MTMPTVEASDTSRKIRGDLTYYRICTSSCGHRVVAQGRHFDEARKVADQVSSNPCPDCRGGDSDE